MSTMSRPYSSDREAVAAAKDAVMWTVSDTQTDQVNVLLTSGDTVRVVRRGRKVTTTKVAGHVTHGMWIDPSDLPCIVA